MGLLYGLAMVILIVNSEVGFSQDTPKDDGAPPAPAGSTGAAPPDSADMAHGPPKRPNWDIASRDNVQWLAVIYQEALPPDPSSKTKPVKADNPGLACGGVLVSPNKVLTLCACVRSFLLINSGRQAAQDPEDIDIIAPDIYVTFWLQPTQFIADQQYVVSTNPIQFMPTCFNLVVDIAEKKKKRDLLRTKPAVMFFAPEVQQFKVLPVKPIVLKPINYKFYEAVFGFSQVNKSLVLFDDNHQVFHPEVEAELNYFRPEEPFPGWDNVKCKDSEYCQMQTWKGVISEPTEVKSMMRCVCNKTAGFQLCEGLPGFPFMADEDLIGLMATPMECKSGNQIALLFDDKIVQEINEFLKQNQDPKGTTAVSTEETKTPAAFNPGPQVSQVGERQDSVTPPQTTLSHSLTLIPAKSSIVLMILHFRL